jgi:hypothetical protein
MASAAPLGEYKDLETTPQCVVFDCIPSGKNLSDFDDAKLAYESKPTRQLARAMILWSLPHQSW